MSRPSDWGFFDRMTAGTKSSPGSSSVASMSGLAARSTCSRRTSVPALCQLRRALHWPRSEGCVAQERARGESLSLLSRDLRSSRRGVHRVLEESGGGARIRLPAGGRNRSGCPPLTLAKPGAAFQLVRWIIRFGVYSGSKGASHGADCPVLGRQGRRPTAASRFAADRRRARERRRGITPSAPARPTAQQE